MQAYIPETKLSPNEIQAGLDNGTLVAFREDANGVMWYQSQPYPTMFGTPCGNIIFADGPADDDFEDDDEA